MEKLCVLIVSFLIGISPVTASVDQGTSSFSGHTDVPGVVVYIFENVTNVADSVSRSLRKFTGQQFTRLKSGQSMDHIPVNNQQEETRNDLDENIIVSQNIPAQSTQLTNPVLSLISGDDYQITLVIKKSTANDSQYILDILCCKKNGEIFHKVVFIDSKNSVLL